MYAKVKEYANVEKYTIFKKYTHLKIRTNLKKYSSALQCQINGGGRGGRAGGS